MQKQKLVFIISLLKREKWQSLNNWSTLIALSPGLMLRRMSKQCIYLQTESDPTTGFASILKQIELKTNRKK